MQKKLDAAYRRIARNTLPIALENCRPTGIKGPGRQLMCQIGTGQQVAKLHVG